MRRLILLLTRSFAWIVLPRRVTTTGVMYFVSANLVKREVNHKFDIHAGDIRELINTCAMACDSGQPLRRRHVIQVNGKDTDIGLAMLPISVNFLRHFRGNAHG